MVNFSKSRSEVKVKVIFGAAFHKLKFEPSLKSLRSYSQLGEFDLLLDFDLDLEPRPFKTESLPDLNIATYP